MDYCYESVKKRVAAIEARTVVSAEQPVEPPKVWTPAILEDLATTGWTIRYLNTGIVLISVLIAFIFIMFSEPINLLNYVVVYLSG